MKKYIFALLSAATFMTSGCDSILERPELTKPLDETYGKTDNEYRLYVNEAYPVYFDIESVFVICLSIRIPTLCQNKRGMHTLL